MWRLFFQRQYKRVQKSPAWRYAVMLPQTSSIHQSIVDREWIENERQIQSLYSKKRFQYTCWRLSRGSHLCNRTTSIFMLQHRIYGGQFSLWALAQNRVSKESHRYDHSHKKLKPIERCLIPSRLIMVPKLKPVVTYVVYCFITWLMQLVSSPSVAFLLIFTYFRCMHWNITRCIIANVRRNASVNKYSHSRMTQKWMHVNACNQSNTMQFLYVC